MRCVVQRVKKAAVLVGGLTVGEIGQGLLALVGVGPEDNSQDIDWLAEKLIGLRIFEDDEGKMNLSLTDVGGEILLVSQFTLFGDCRKGKRPSFSLAAPTEQARELFGQLADTVRLYGVKAQTGQFQADMDVELVNQGPVTILLDSKKSF
ncbi:MAG: D-aminoacyl-tRNA deacylase [Candidatus Dichloromethanomonas elyunquensis]|nr:MAG: D-aminoacyl-tRNA deacylase [Candidatus Dichloromethanomonas elyunquensis]